MTTPSKRPGPHFSGHKHSGTMPTVRPRPDETTQIQPDAPALRTPRHGVPRNRPRLVMLQGPSVGAMFRLTDGSVVGRQAEVAIHIDSAEVSRKHARFYVVNDAFFVEDLGSRNGTFVNGARIDRPTALDDGDKVEIGGIVLRFALFDQIDEDYQAQIYESSLRDALTRSFNRKYLDERLDSECAYSLRHDTPLSLLVFDVDRFKSINDGHGHQVGDAVLVQLVQLVHRVIRAEDVLARYGGEEFVVLSRGIRLPEAMQFGERLRAAIARQPFVYAPPRPPSQKSESGPEMAAVTRIPVTISVGVASMPSPEVHQASHLFDRADRGLYVAKDRGRDRVETV